jgi:FtsP/CotA-like multicopper oxidase with cupredoxin domain
LDDEDTDETLTHIVSGKTDVSQLESQEIYSSRMAPSNLSRLALLLSFLGPAVAENWVSPEYKFLFQFPLPIPSVKPVKRLIPHNVTGKDVRYYEIEIKQFTQQVYPNLGPATLWGYDGTSPGPTFIQEKGTEAVVRFINNGHMANSVHLHGSYSVRLNLPPPSRVHAIS